MNRTRVLLTAGVDVGTRSIKVALMDHAGATARVVGTAVVPVLGAREARDTRTALRESWKRVLREAAVAASDVLLIGSTGGRESGQHHVGPFHRRLALSLGARYLFPDATAVLDVGASQIRCARFDAPSGARQHAASSRVAPAADDALEVLARSRGLSLDKASMRPEAAAIHDALASRAVRLTRRLAVTGPTVLTGALVLDPQFVGALWRHLLDDPSRIELLASRDAVFAGALGAALLAARRYRRMVRPTGQLEIRESAGQDRLARDIRLN